MRSRRQRIIVFIIEHYPITYTYKFTYFPSKVFAFQNSLVTKIKNPLHLVYIIILIQGFIIATYYREMVVFFFLYRFCQGSCFGASRQKILDRLYFWTLSKEDSSRPVKRSGNRRIFNCPERVGGYCSLCFFPGKCTDLVKIMLRLDRDYHMKSLRTSSHHKACEISSVFLSG